MTYALIEKGAVKTYPYSFAQLRGDNPQVSFPSEVTDEWLVDYGVVKVVPTARPELAVDKNVVEAAPVLVGGIWTQVWTETNASAGQIAERTKIAAQQTEFDAAKLDAWIVQFLAMTPSGAQDFVNNNSATLAALRSNVARLAYAVRVLVRREFDA